MPNAKWGTPEKYLKGKKIIFFNSNIIPGL